MVTPLMEEMVTKDTEISFSPLSQQNYSLNS